MTKCYVIEPIHDSSGSRVEPGTSDYELEPAVFLRLSKAGAVESMEARAARLDGATRALRVKEEAEAKAAAEARAIERQAAGEEARAKAAAEEEAASSARARGKRRR